MNVNWRLVGIAALLAGLFLLVAWAMHAGHTRHVDHRLLGLLRRPDKAHSLLGPHWDLKLLIGLTTLGAGSVRAPLTIAAAIVLAQRWRGREAAMLVFAVAGGAIALPILKALFDRARPDLLWHLVNETSMSFPSGHAMGSMILYPLLGLIAGATRGPGRARGLALIGVAIAILVGLTRIALGVHWASDVLGGWLIGGATAVAAAGVFRRPERGTAPAPLDAGAAPR